VARRRLRLALREARESKHLTQAQVAEAMEWSSSKVMRIETGEVTITPNDLRPLLTHLGITDRATVERYVNDARVSRTRKQWWDQPRFREHLSPATRQVIQFEAEATTSRHLAAAVVFGPLQTARYARAVLDKWRGELPDAYLEAQFDARMRRREQLLSRKKLPQMQVLLDESLLHRVIGGSDVLGEQLADLATLTDSYPFEMRIMPFTIDAPISNVAAYDVYYLGDSLAEENAVVYREAHVTDEIVDDRTQIRRHLDIFEHLWQASLTEAASIRLLNERAAVLMRQGT
jgi:transcriptional regulator with XRE-family HTH domain